MWEEKERWDKGPAWAKNILKNPNRQKRDRKTTEVKEKRTQGGEKTIS